ncbi:LysE family translocator, partial [Streptomyces xiaopingdaonensis]|uniref:LysE family translocator n=1 Tax=Streptomyces xiaopingdaonensis TaxID=1565415 RepID=UPI00037BF9A4
MTLDTGLLAFTAVAAGMVAMPGADFAVVVRNALASRGAGVASALGVAGGLLVHTAVAALGLAALAVTVPGLLPAVQLLGGLYILWLGVRTLHGAVRAPSPGVPVAEAPAPSGRGLREGFLTNALNPKAVVFFVSLLPQFSDGRSGTTALLAGIVVVLALAWFTLLALAVDRMGPWLRRPRTALAVQGVT